MNTECELIDEEKACEGVEDGLPGIVLPPDSGIDDIRLDFELPSFGPPDDSPPLPLDVAGFGDIDAGPGWPDED